MTLPWLAQRYFPIFAVLCHQHLLSGSFAQREIIIENETHVDLPFSWSDLLSCSVSASVKAELDWLDSCESRPCALTHSMVQSGEMPPAFWIGSASLSCVWWLSPVSAQKLRPRRGAGPHIPSCLSDRLWPARVKVHTQYSYSIQRAYAKSSTNYKL